MNKEKYWKAALEKTSSCIETGKLTPIKTIDITNTISSSNDFVIRKIDTNKLIMNKNIGPKLNPFNPWDKDLEINKIGSNHQLILNKYPVQVGHILLITKSWKPQNGWLDIADWNAIKKVNNDTSGLWFFNSDTLAGASQPHRHIQLLRRSKNEKSCPRNDWFINFNNSNIIKNKLYSKIEVNSFNFKEPDDKIYKKYLFLSRKLGLGDPLKDKKPRCPYNLLITNKWIALIKRKNDNVHGFSINGLGFAGYILVTNNSDINYLKKFGPERLLESFV